MSAPGDELLPHNPEEKAFEALATEIEAKDSLAVLMAAYRALDVVGRRVLEETVRRIIEARP